MFIKKASCLSNLTLYLKEAGEKTTVNRQKEEQGLPWKERKYRLGKNL